MTAVKDFIAGFVGTVIIGVYIMFLQSLTDPVDAPHYVQAILAIGPIMGLIVAYLLFLIRVGDY